MFIGHYGVAFGVKRLAPGLSLVLLFLAVQLPDLLWPDFLLLHWEHVTVKPGITKMSPLNFTDYPISHSLLMDFVWGCLAGLLYWLVKRNVKNSLIIAVCIVSHWLLDLLVHHPDLPIYFGNSPKAGFGLWNHPVIEPVLEISIFITGLFLYLKNSSAKNIAGNIILWVLVMLLLTLQISDSFSPNSPGAKGDITDISSIGWYAQLLWLPVIMALFIDRNRRVKYSPA